VKTVFVTLPLNSSAWDEKFPRFLKSCSANHVRRIVKLSFYHSMKPKSEQHPSLHYGDPDNAAYDGFHDVPFVHKHALCDGDLVRHSNFDVTIICASHLMSNIFHLKFERKALTENHQLHGASDGKGVNYVSPNDVADVAVDAILNKTSKRQIYTLTGPMPITDQDVANILTDQLGIRIEYVEKPLSFFDAQTAALEKIKATGIEEAFPKGDTHRVIGRDPESFADYLATTDRMTAIERDVLFTHFGQMQYEETKETTDEDLANADERDDLKPTEAEIGMQMNALEQPKLEAAH
jgi:nucleoside-diphosphate-sugar epimerase